VGKIGHAIPMHGPHRVVVDFSTTVRTTATDPLKVEVQEVDTSLGNARTYMVDSGADDTTFPGYFDQIGDIYLWDGRQFKCNSDSIVNGDWNVAGNRTVPYKRIFKRFLVTVGGDSSSR
jgi:hypothetical protein